MSVKLRLSVMMFLQYAIWGSWAPVLSAYLQNDLGFSGTQIGLIYSLLPLATIISPFLGGQIADRYFPTEKLIALLQLAGGGFLILVASTTDYTTMIWLMLIYSILYAPTLALTNSIAMINLANSEKEFGSIRVWGTIGWIVAGLSLAFWRSLAEAQQVATIQGDTLVLAGIFSIVMGLLAFGLPHTPPRKEGSNPWAFLEALKMLKNKNMIIFFVIAFIVATELQFYYVLTAPFLTSDQIGVANARVSGVMVIAQLAEIIVMAFLLPRFLPKYGIRKVMLMGILAWPLRYAIFAIGGPTWLVLASLALHGFCYVFFFTAAFIYMDQIAPKDIRHSAQSLITLILLGFGNYLGALFSGLVQSIFTSAEQGTNWTGVFLVPFFLTMLCAVGFLIFFKEETRESLQSA
ncbi:MAG: MFS transporter [Candidatus Marinimicrobia bacterium]|nr:MFS transporter [Candidatus Neomarinimicrobiota bacterium]